MLALVAPPSFRRPLVEALGAAGTRVSFHRRPEPGGGGDPYRLEALSRRLEGRAEGLLLVVPPHRSPHTVAPGPVVGGLPVGLLFAREPGALASWLGARMHRRRSAPGRRAVLAAWEEHYLRLGRRFARRLRADSASRTTTWFADRLNRPAMLERLARGPALAAYFGHGHPEGLGGYHGVYREHFEAQRPWRPCGLFMAWACETLPFGRFLVESGHAEGFFGSTSAVRTADNAVLAELAGGLFEWMRPASLGSWLRAIEASLVPGSSVHRAWCTYRLLGSPLLAL